MSSIYTDVQIASGAFSNDSFSNGGVFSPTSPEYPIAFRIPAVPGAIVRIEDIQISADGLHDMEIWWSPIKTEIIPISVPVAGGTSGYTLIYKYAARRQASPFGEPDDSGRTLQKPLYMGGNLSASGEQNSGGVGTIQFVMPGAVSAALRAMTTYTYTPTGGAAL